MRNPMLGGYGAMMMAALMMGAAGMGGLPNLRIPGSDRKARKCALPGCEKETYHNGGYCCAEHCKQHRENIKASRLRANNKPQGGSQSLDQNGKEK